MIIEADRATELVMGLKACENLNDVRFVKAYKGNSGESPLESILVTVATGNGECNSFLGGYSGSGKRADEVISEIILNVYCPCQGGGDGVTDIVNTIVGNISSLDINSIISDIHVSEIKVSNEYEAVYRTITLSLRYTKAGGATVE